MDTLICDGLDLNDNVWDRCYYTNITESWGFCNGYQDLRPYYFYCCKGDLCNNVEADLKQCVHSPILEEFYEGFYQCLYDNSVVENIL